MIPNPKTKKAGQLVAKEVWKDGVQHPEQLSPTPMQQEQRGQDETSCSRNSGVRMRQVESRKGSSIVGDRSRGQNRRSRHCPAIMILGRRRRMAACPQV